VWRVEHGLEGTLDDLTSLFGNCRFSDCRHDAEPGCAVKQALAEGRLAPERWESYVKLQRELEFLAVERREHTYRLNRRHAGAIRRLAAEGPDR